VRKLWESVTRRAHFVLHSWECELVGPRETKLDPAEVSDCKWMSTPDAANMPLMFSDTRYFLREVWPQTRDRR
jgi:hypothetical protein